MRDPYRLDPNVTRQIVLYIKGGATPYKAAEAVGVPWQKFQTWMRNPLFEDFQDAVKRAGAYARVSAECRVHKDDPQSWLLKGPGRAKADEPEPGWSTEIKITASMLPSELNYDALTDEQLLALESIRRTLLRSGDSASAISEIPGEVVSINGRPIPGAPAPTALDRETGSSRAGGDPPASSLDAAEAREIDVGVDILPSVVPGKEPG